MDKLKLKKYRLVYLEIDSDYENLYVKGNVKFDRDLLYKNNKTVELYKVDDDITEYELNVMFEKLKQDLKIKKEK